jgi:two-component system alkaline phosphatase synthesis response regulator PhoP
VLQSFSQETAVRVLIADKKICLLILDADHPGIDGCQVCRELRKAQLKLPIVLLSSRGDVHHKTSGLNSGADDYITKPYDPLEFIARVRALLRRSTSLQSNSLQSFEFGGKTVDFVKSKVMIRNQVVRLSERESRLLKYFIEHRGQIVTREELLQHVWGYPGALRTRTVDTHIVWLRQKIEDDGGNPQHLLTVHRQGYRFVSN